MPTINVYAYAGLRACNYKVNLFVADGATVGGKPADLVGSMDAVPRSGAYELTHNLLRIMS